MTMTEREYAVSLGLAKPSRGRMSPAAMKAIAEAKAKGQTFRKSDSELYKEELERRRASGEVIRRGRKPSGKKDVVNVVKPERKKRVLTEEHKAAMQAGRKKAKAEGEGAILPLEEHEKGRTYSEEWYARTFYPGAFVCMPSGITYRVVDPTRDEKGRAIFVDKYGRKWKAKVNAGWGVRTCWPDGGKSAATTA